MLPGKKRIGPFAVFQDILQLEHVVFQLLIYFAFDNDFTELKKSQIKFRRRSKPGGAVYGFEKEIALTGYRPGDDSEGTCPAGNVCGYNTLRFDAFAHKPVHTAIGRPEFEPAFGRHFQFQNIRLPFRVVFQIGYEFKNRRDRLVDHHTVLKLHHFEVLL